MRITFLDAGDRPGSLVHDEIHLWVVPLESATDEAVLTADELDRAGRFKMERIRRQFIASRGSLRKVLGAYLDIPPRDIPIHREPSGKPYLDPDLAANLHFNVSHSEMLALYAVTQRGRIGVDIERWRDIPNADSLIERFFTRRERDLFQGLPEADRQAAFFSVWTRKEAALKAIGRGVQSLDQCDVTFCPGEAEQVLRMGDDNAAAEKWFLRSWRPTADFVAAVAVELRGN